MGIARSDRGKRMAQSRAALVVQGDAQMAGLAVIQKAIVLTGDNIVIDRSAHKLKLRDLP